MKSRLVILSILLVPGLCARAATEQEKAFVEKYKTALEKKDTATLQSCLYTTGADPMIVGFYKMMQSNGEGDKVSKIDLVDLTPDDVKKATEPQDGPSGKVCLNLKPTKKLVIMFCEVAAYAKSKGMTLDELLDEIFREFGYFEEKNHSIYFEGADGAEKIRRLLISYNENPPRRMLDSPIIRIRNFEKETIRDVEGDEIPKEKMLIFELADKTRIAVRGSGTEPKIKYYLFGARLPSNGKLSPEELVRARAEIKQRLGALWDWLREDAEQRVAESME